MMKAALVTGGTRGIGQGIARCLAREGFDLALNGIREEAAAADALEELRHLGGRVIYCRGDVSRAADCRAVVEKVRGCYGRLHVLVNNAGVAPRERVDVLDTTEESFGRVIAVNLKGAFFLSQMAARWMLEQKEADPGFSGCIINIGSVSAVTASVNRAEYCVAKAGLGMVTKLFAARLGASGIPVYEIRPGIIKTDMTAGAAGKYDQLIAGGLCVQPRWGMPEDVGRAAAALARGDFPYSTGQVIRVDGGLTLQRL